MARDNGSQPTQGPDSAGNPMPALIGTPGGYDSTPTAVFIAASGNTAAVTAQMPAVSGKTNYVTDVFFANAGATAAIAVDCTVNNITGGTVHIPLTVPTNATASRDSIKLTFNPPLKATGQNLAVNAVHPAAGAGATNTVAHINGYVA